MLQPLHMISGPRNMSTAIMYAFAQHTEITVVDEPFYGVYLRNHPEKDHPGREEILSKMPNTSQNVIQTLRKTEEQGRLFIKNMAHHLAEVGDLSWMQHHLVLHLVRHPAAMIQSFQKVIAQPTNKDLGLKDQLVLYKKLQVIGTKQMVIDAAEILKNPNQAFRKICAFGCMPFQENLLSWPTGPKSYDGIWAPYWYANVHKSSGFTPQSTTTYTVEKQFEQLFQENLLYYRELLNQQADVTTI